jgi:ATP-binding cassette subfamily F protein 3
LVTHDRYLVDALATQIWEIDPDESQMTTFNGTYSQMKEEREQEAARLSALQIDSTLRKGRRPSAPTKSTKEERRRIAQLQELENSIAELEAKLANLGLQLESPLVKPHEVAKLGTEYERVQKEMDAKLNEWERIQVQ